MRDQAFLNPTDRLVLVFTDDDGARFLDVARITALLANHKSIAQLEKLRAGKLKFRSASSLAD